jgi:hypothetical protein
MTYEPANTRQERTGKLRPSLVPGIAALVCAAFAAWNLYAGLQLGALSPEFALFLILTVVFGALWISSLRRR